MEYTLLHGDVIEQLYEIEQESIDLVVTSPPYNVGIEYENNSDSISWFEYWNWTSSWMGQIWRVLKPHGRICINHYLGLYDRLQKIEEFPIYGLLSITKSYGFNNHRIVVWSDNHKSKLTAWGSWLSASAPFIQMPYEGILIASKSKDWKLPEKGESTISKEEFIQGVGGVWNIKPDTQNKYPATFPIQLPRRCINLLSYKGATVLDPFCGSGSTGIACLQTDRNFIGIDNSRKAIELAKQRIENSRTLF